MMSTLVFRRRTPSKRLLSPCYLMRFLQTMQNSTYAESSSGKDIVGITYDPRPYKDVGLTSLVNSYMVYRLCNFEKLVESAPYILDKLSSIGLSGVTNKVIKNTFFKHFCGGECSDELRTVLESLKRRHISVILDYACEADYDEKAKFDISTAVESSSKFTQKIMETLDWAIYGYKPMFVAKVTSLVSPSVLVAWSDTLRVFRKGIEDLCKGATSKGGKIDFETFKTLSVLFPSINQHKDMAKKYFNMADMDKDGLIDYVDTLHIFSVDHPDAMSLLVGCTQEISQGRLKLSKLTNEHVEAVRQIMPVIDQLFKECKNRGLVTAVDAEQTYFHPAIDDVAMSFSRKYYYPTGPGILNTYQMYLKDRKVMENYIESSKRLKLPIGMKVVRGAYMESERARADLYGYEDPIQPSAESTSENYNKKISFLIDELANETPETKLFLLIASHNQNSIAMALQKLKAKNIKDKSVMFAQLYGMRDPLTEYLLKTPYLVAKYLPYGPVDITIPYLIRRAQENKSMLLSMKRTTELKNSQVNKLDDQLILDEIMFRLMLKNPKQPEARF